MKNEELLKCPECGSQEVTVSHLQRFMANTGDHWVHAVKTARCRLRSNLPKMPMDRKA